MYRTATAMQETGIPFLFPWYINVYLTVYHNNIIFQTQLKNAIKQQKSAASATLLNLRPTGVEPAALRIGI